jgi:hypothetical protein
MDDGERESAMYFITGNLFYDHLARVNTPAQPYATVLEANFLDSTEMQGTFANGEVLDGRLMGAALIDSRDGLTEFLIEDKLAGATDVTESWSTSDWAEAYILTSLADAGRIKDDVADDVLAKVEAFRTSERKPNFGQPRSRVGPNGIIPIHDAATAQAALNLVDVVRGANPDSLRSRVRESLSSLVSISVGDSTMSDPAKVWAEIVASSEGLDEVQCQDWSDWDGDFNELALDEGAAEEVGVRAGIIGQDARLTTSSRKQLPDSAFCGPNRSFPVHDAAHVRNALARLPQATRFSSEQKARILACVRSRAKRFGVEVSKDQLTYENLVGMLDRQEDPEVVLDQKAPDGETDAQAKDRLAKQLSAARAKIADQESRISTLVDDNKDLRGKLHDMLAHKIFDMRLQLKKQDLLQLAKPEERQEYLDRLKLRTTASLLDASVDLEAEIAAAAKLSDDGKGDGEDIRDQEEVDDETDTKTDNGKDDKDDKSSQEPKPARQIDRLAQALSGK